MKLASMVLIVVGIIILLINFDINFLGISSFFKFIISLWPLILIYLGWKMYKSSKNPKNMLNFNLHNFSGINIESNPVESASFEKKEHFDQELNTEISLSTELKDIVGNLQILPCESPLFGLTFLYNDTNYYQHEYQAGETGILRIANTMSRKKVVKEIVKKEAIELTLNKQVKHSLSITAAIGSHTADLTGLSVREFQLSSGASRFKAIFSEINPIQLEMFKIKCGASTLEMIGLANSNASTLDFEGGAGKYSFDFGGKLQQNLTCNIKSGVSLIQLTVPESTPAILINNSELSHFTVPNGYEKLNERTFVNMAGKNASESTPKLSINIEAGLSKLSLN